jgi:DNA-binding response OmpR family regulator
MKPRILIVDDEETIRYFLKLELEQQNYEVWDVESGEKALKLLDTHNFDVALLDLRLPGIGGLEVMRRLREKSPESSVIIITAYATLDSAIDALRQGAHDYVLKPFNTRDLLGTIADGVARRGRHVAPNDAREEELVVGSLRLDMKSLQAHFHDVPLKLTPTELDLLLCFMRMPNTALDSVTLLKTIRGYELSESEARSIVRVHVHRLRQKLEVDPTQPALIVTVAGGRYLLEAI